MKFDSVLDEAEKKRKRNKKQLHQPSLYRPAANADLSADQDEKFRRTSKSVDDSDMSETVDKTIKKRVRDIQDNE